jgi:predicted metal-binding membrane protein
MSSTEPAAAERGGGGAGPTALEALLARDRLVVVSVLAGVIVAAWAWILAGAGMDMDHPMAAGAPGQPDAGMPDRGAPMGSMATGGIAAGVMAPAGWTPGHALLVFLMWWAMMVGMMLPSAAPVLLLFARVNRKEKAGGRPYVPTAVFAAGYLAAWAGFSAAASGLHWGLERLGLVSPAMMATTSAWLGGSVLVAAGLWQLTPVKDVCLRHCRSPVRFLAEGWRPGRWGAFRMGLRHGAYCLGCCWLLMGLLFFGGVMNPVWIAGLAALVLVEKATPMGRWLARGAGAALVVWGVAVLAAAS